MTTFETTLAKCRLEGELLYLETKPGKRTFKNLQEHYKVIEEHLHEKVYWLLDLTICEPFPKEVRDSISKELPRFCNALALISQKPCENMIANFFTAVESTHLPVKKFSSTADALKWIMTLQKKLSK